MDGSVATVQIVATDGGEIVRNVSLVGEIVELDGRAVIRLDAERHVMPALAALEGGRG